MRATLRFRRATRCGHARLVPIRNATSAALWGLCPGHARPPDAWNDNEAGAEGGGARNAMPPPQPACLEGPCSWARAQVNTAAGAHCTLCKTLRKKGSRLDRCTVCRTWCCSFHPGDTRNPCRINPTPEPGTGQHQPSLADMWRSAGSIPEPAEEGDQPTLEDVLARLAAEPGPRTLVWVPRSLEARVADLLASCMDLVVVSMEQVAGGGLPLEAAYQANLLLRALPEMLLRIPRKHAARNSNAAAVSADLRLAAVLRARIDRAELQDWTALATEALADRQAARGEGARRDSMSTDTGAADSPAAFAALAQLVAGKVHSGCVKSALQILTGNGKALANETTWAKIVASVAEEAPSGEDEATRDAVAAALTQQGARAPCRVRTVKRRLRVARPGAEPGPSGWRNSHVH